MVNHHIQLNRRTEKRPDRWGANLILQSWQELPLWQAYERERETATHSLTPLMRYKEGLLSLLAQEKCCVWNNWAHCVREMLRLEWEHYYLSQTVTDSTIYAIRRARVEQALTWCYRLWCYIQRTMYRTRHKFLVTCSREAKSMMMDSHILDIEHNKGEQYRVEFSTAVWEKQPILKPQRCHLNLRRIGSAQESTIMGKP